MNVRKANGELVPLDIKEIQEKTKSAEIGLDNVFAAEVEVDSKIQFYDGITTKEITESLIKTAVNKIDIDKPDYTFFAARMFIKDLAHSVGRTLGGIKGNAYSPLLTYFKYGEENGKIIIGLKDKFDLNQLDRYIKPKRDLLFTYLGIKTFYDRYILKDKNGDPFEMPQHLFMGVAMFVAQNETNPLSMSKEARKEYTSLKLDESGQKVYVRTYWAKKFYDMLSTFEVMAATPTLSNGRTPRHQMSSCYIGSTPDSIEGIFDTYREQSLLSKFGGGIGWDWMQVRGSSSSIDETKNAAGGIVPFLKIDNDVALAVDQLGCVIKDSYVKVLKSVKTVDFTHDFRRDYERFDLNEQELLDNVSAYASNFAFEYGKFSKNLISSFLFDYIQNKNGLEKLTSMYGMTKDQYKKIIVRYKKINKGLPEGFEILKNHSDFAISKEGIIINLKSLKPLSLTKDRKGYIRVSIGKETKALHKLLVKQYIIEDISDLTINHKDDNKENNRLNNLEIISNRDNISKEWNSSSKKRTEKSRIRKYLSGTAQLNDKKRGTHKITITNIIEEIVPISKVRIGDLIKSFNIKTNEIEYKTILSKYDINVKIDDQIQIVFSDDSSIITSKWHPSPKLKDDYFVYVRSDELRIGDIGLNSEGEEKEIKDINMDIDIIYPENFENKEDFYDLTVKDNNNYFCSSLNKDGDFHLIHNTRKGAIAVYIEPWHIDVEDFLSLKKNSGEERRRTHDLFPALWLNDIFMERVEADEEWSLFSPENVPGLTETYGEEFNELYRKYEEDKTIPRKIVMAKDIWKEVLRQYFETGNPFLTFKDRANEVNPNKHAGIIRSSNLCTEIFQNTEPNKYLIKFEFEDGSTESYEEEKMLTTDDGSVKPAKKVSALDSLNGKQIFFVGKETIEGKTAVCNLASVNLSKVNTKEKFEEIIPIAVRFLDNVIDLNFYPHRKTKITNLKSRAIGLGVMGEAQMLAEAKIMFGTQEHFDKIDEIMEIFSYNTIKASSDLGKEKGSYPEFEGSEWSKGIFPADNAKKEVSELTTRKGTVYDWDKLAKDGTTKYMRNGYLMAVAPTSSISILTGTTQAIEPIFKRFWREENLSGVIPVVAPNLCPDTWQYYVPAFELDQLLLVKAGAVRQKWLDQGQSLNIFVDLENVTGKKLHNIYMTAWKFGIKSTYYLRSQSPKALDEEEVEDRSQECFGCQ